MTKIAIVSDTSADLPVQMAKELEVHLVNAFVHFGTKTYVVGELGLDNFHDKMESAGPGNFPKTSQPKASQILETYEKLRATGYDAIVSIHVSSKLSGTINSAHIAKGMIDGIDIRVIDSQAVSINIIAVLQRARELIDDGMPLNTITQDLERFSKSLTSYLTIKSLDNLMRGGRISKIRYRFGRLFNIKPILELKHGTLEPYAKARGLERARAKMYDIATELYSSDDMLNYIIAHARKPEDARLIEKTLLEEYPHASGTLLEMGIVVSVHAGRGAILLLVYS